MTKDQACNRVAKETEFGEHYMYEAMHGLNDIQSICHELARKAGWWDEYIQMPQQYRKYFLGSKRDLMHTELAEATEGARKDLMDDHLPHRKMEEVELADAIIRILDYAGALGYNVAEALIEKVAYNLDRADHKPEARAAEGGKSL